MSRRQILPMIYYTLRPLIPRSLQILLRRAVILPKRRLHSAIWPIDRSAAKPPEPWPGWPDQKQFALVLTHDVESASGHQKCLDLMILEQELGFRSSFNFVPERYQVSAALRTVLTRNGFEVGVHGLRHDGKLYSSRRVFEERAHRINMYLQDWNAVGFRSPSMHHNLEWLHALTIEYDASTFDTDPFEPQADGARTIFPFWVEGKGRHRGYVELPYTLPQDFTLFILLREKTIDIWKRKLDWVAANSGMALLNTHPDYMTFSRQKAGREEYPANNYTQFLAYINEKYQGRYWHVLPKDMSRFWLTHMANAVCHANRRTPTSRTDV